MNFKKSNWSSSVEGGWERDKTWAGTLYRRFSLLFERELPRVWNMGRYNRERKKK